jgi:hypothetical protein
LSAYNPVDGQAARAPERFDSPLLLEIEAVTTKVQVDFLSCPFIPGQYLFEAYIICLCGQEHTAFAQPAQES